MADADDPTRPLSPRPDVNASDVAASDVAALAAERDALRAQVDELSHRRRSGVRVRSLVAGLLVAVFALTYVAAGVGIWMHRNTLNTDVWAERVVPLGADPAVQAALATWATDQLMETVDPEALFEDALPERAQILAIPLSSAVEGFVAERVQVFFASDRFEELWATVAIRAHEEAIRTLRDQRPLVDAGTDDITINLVPLLDEVLNDIVQRAPSLVGSDVQLPEVSIDDVPDRARERLGEALGVELSDDFGVITVDDGGQLATAQQAVRLLDRLVIGTALLTVVVAAVALWITPRRRRTLLQLLGAAAIGSIIVRRISFLLQEEALELVRIPENRLAVRVVLLGFLSPLTNAAATALWIIGAIVLVTVITGPYPWAVTARAAASRAFGTTRQVLTDRAEDDATAQWVAANQDALRVAGYVAGALALWFVDLTFVSFFFIAVLVAGWQVVVARLATAADLDEPVQPDGPGSTPGTMPT